MGSKLWATCEMNFWESEIQGSLRTADAFPVVASLPPKNSVCEPERQNDFRDVNLFSQSRFSS